jgi:hypothetical protein
MVFSADQEGKRTDSAELQRLEAELSVAATVESRRPIPRPIVPVQKVTERDIRSNKAEVTFLFIRL